MGRHSGRKLRMGLALLAVAALSAAALVVPTAEAGIPTAEREALIALHDSTNGPGWTNQTNWLGPPGTECSWYGVTCDPGENSVLLLSLDSNQLTGSIPPELGNLANLQYLSLSYNRLTGSIPPELGNLANVQWFELRSNQLTGPIPPELGNLTNLQYLLLFGNQLTGSIPPELGNLASLQYFELSVNQLTGSIPPELGSLTNLQYFDLSQNHLTGSIPPELGNLANLQRLILQANQLTGSIPPELGNLANLQWLYLGANQLTGSIPPEMGNLASLQYLSLSPNQLTGPIPPELGNLANLVTFQLADNQLTGSIPPELGNLANLRNLYLHSNQLTGSIPPELGNLANLQNLFLWGNQLTGPIPPELGNLASLQSLYLFSNQLTGSIPPELGNLSNLQWFYLRSNKLTGPVPTELLNLTSLVNSGSEFRWNALYTGDATLEAFLNAKQFGGDWESTQTVAPSGLAAGVPTSTSVPLTWTAIPYTADPGGYEVYYGTSSGGPYTLFGTTVNKSGTNTTVTGLTPSTGYYFRVRTVTQPHGNNANTVSSEYTSPVAAATSGGIVDTDGDELSDAWEIFYFGNLTTTQGAWNQDADGDGLSDKQEFFIGTNPTATDTDGDGKPDAADAFPLDPTKWADSDGDGVADNLDNCPSDYNPDQADMDGDGIGDACDPDADGDGYISIYYPLGDDCEDLDPNIYPGAGGCIGGSTTPKAGTSPNADGDNWPDSQDNCPQVYQTTQLDSDVDGAGDACDNCPTVYNPGQRIPVWYKDQDGDGYSDGQTLTQCGRPAGYRPPSELSALSGDCDDANPNVNPGTSEVAGNGIDDDCNPATPDTVQAYTIKVKTITENGNTRSYETWEPRDGNTIQVEFQVWGPNGEVGTTPNSAGEVITSPLAFSLAPPPAGRENPTRYPGKYTNDPSGVTDPDFTYNLTYALGQIQLTSHDFSGSITVRAAATIELGDGIRVDLGSDFSFPKDSDGDGLADFWESQYGNLDPQADPDNDGLTNFQEYGGVMWGNLVKVNPDAVYNTVAYVPEGGAQGTVRHIRTNPTRRDLFVKFVSFDAYPFAIGEAFSQIGVDVHGLGGTLAAQLSEANIDVATVTLAAGAYSNESGHILYRKTRDWTFATLGYSSPASESVYATSCKVYRQTHEFLFNDKPYVDGMTLTIGGDMRNPSAWGAANGGLDAVTMVEDASDNGRLDRGEDKLANKALDGDHPVPIDNNGDGLADLPDSWNYGNQLSPFNVNVNSKIELPLAGSASQVNPAREYTLAQVMKHVITHELGHAAGCGIHTTVSSCVMYNTTTDFVRDNWFCTDAATLIRIHNN